MVFMFKVRLQRGLKFQLGDCRWLTLRIFKFFLKFCFVFNKGKLHVPIRIANFLHTVATWRSLPFLAAFRVLGSLSVSVV